MERVSLEDLEASVLPDGTVRRGLTGPLGATAVAINRYRVPPGGGLPGGLHAHADQEEVFVVRRGTAMFETLDGSVTVGEGAAIRFAPGEFQSGRNVADGDLVVLALGAPRDGEDVRVPLPCPACDAASMRVAAGAAGPVFGCPDCGAERVARPCPACGHEDLRIALGDGTGTVVVCRGCGAEYDEPPTRS